MARRKTTTTGRGNSGVLREQLKTLREDVDGHAETLYGNGHQGLKDRMLVAEGKIDAHEKVLCRMDESAKGIKSDARRAVFAGVGSIVVAVVVFLATVLWTQVTGPVEKTEMRAIVQEAIAQTLDAVKAKQP